MLRSACGYFPGNTLKRVRPAFYNGPTGEIRGVLPQAFRQMVDRTAQTQQSLPNLVAGRRVHNIAVTCRKSPFIRRRPLPRPYTPVGHEHPGRSYIWLYGICPYRGDKTQCLMLHPGLQREIDIVIGVVCRWIDMAPAGYCWLYKECSFLF